MIEEKMHLIEAKLEPLHQRQLKNYLDALPPELQYAVTVQFWGRVAGDHPLEERRHRLSVGMAAVVLVVAAVCVTVVATAAVVRFSQPQVLEQLGRGADCEVRHE